MCLNIYVFEYLLCQASLLGRKQFQFFQCFLVGCIFRTFYFVTILCSMSSLLA